MKIDKATSRVDTIDIYRRLWQALDGPAADIAQDVSDLCGEMARTFYSDTGVKAGPAKVCGFRKE